MRKGVINIVEVLVLLLIFLAAAAFFATFYLSATQQEASTVKKSTEQQALLLNPPVKIIGIITVENNLDNSTTGNETAVFACVQNTGGSIWWLDYATLIKGTQGPVYALWDHINTAAKLAKTIKDGNVADTTILSEYESNYTSTAFKELNKLLAVCYAVGSGKVLAVFNYTIACDANNLTKVVDDAVNECNATANKYAVPEWAIYFVQPFNYLPPGSVGVVAYKPIDSSTTEQGGTFTASATFSESLRPNPAQLYQLAQENELYFDNITKWLETTNYVVAAVNSLKAQCESCTFYVG